jgi:hypothetical protein
MVFRFERDEEARIRLVQTTQPKWYEFWIWCGRR